jgi:hypothetical protein
LLSERHNGYGQGMTPEGNKLENPTSDDDVRERLDDAAEAAEGRGGDEQERRERQQGAAEAERMPRRQ